MGWHTDPLAYPPHHVLTWQGRFDDPRINIDPSARFRTLYFARRRTTAFRETLQDLRPDTRTRADFRSLMGAEPPPGVVTRQWRADRRVGRARINVAASQIIDLEDLDLRRALEEEHAALLAAHGMPHLDITQLRSHQRVVTQTIALDLRAKGTAVIAYRSNLDGQQCVAVLEGPAAPKRWGQPQTIEADDADLIEVCRAWKLQIL